MEEGTLKNLLIGIRQWVNGLLNEISFVVSAHINELHEDVDSLKETKQDILEAGDNIEITSGGTISVTGITEPIASDFDIKDLADTTGLREEWSSKQDALTAGDNIEIDSAGTINVTGVVTSQYIANIWRGTQDEYDALQTYENNTLYVIVEQQ